MNNFKRFKKLVWRGFFNFKNCILFLDYQNLPTDVFFLHPPSNKHRTMRYIQIPCRVNVYPLSCPQPADGSYGLLVAMTYPSAWSSSSPPPATWEGGECGLCGDVVRAFGRINGAFGKRVRLLHGFPLMGGGGAGRNHGPRTLAGRGGQTLPRVWAHPRALGSRLSQPEQRGLQDSCQKENGKNNVRAGQASSRCDQHGQEKCKAELLELWLQGPNRSRRRLDTSTV